MGNTSFRRHGYQFRTERIIDRFQPTRFVVEIAQVGVHEGNEPDVLADLFHAHFLCAKTWLTLVFRRCQQMRPQVVMMAVQSCGRYSSSSTPIASLAF